MEDKDLLELIGHSPEKGWGQMIDQYTGLMAYIVRGRGGPHMRQEDVEDLVSEVFIKAYETWDRYDPEKASIKAYLATIATRRAIDFFRKTKPTEEMVELASEGDFVEDLVEQESRAELIQALDLLTYPDKQLLMGRYFLGLKSKDLGLKYGLKAANVDQRIRRALIKLRNLLEVKNEKQARSLG